MAAETGTMAAPALPKTVSNGESPTPQSNAAPNNQTPGHPSFRRALYLVKEMLIGRPVDSDRGQDSAPETSTSQETPPVTEPGHAFISELVEAYNTTDGTPGTTLSADKLADLAAKKTSYAQFMKPKFARAPIKEAGRVAYLGESSNLSLLVHDRHGTSDVVHYPLPDGARGTKSRLTGLDNIEIDILHQRGAFLLPPRSLCDELVEEYFKWVAPVVPVINKSRFMRQYQDPQDPPSLLLLQAVLLAGSRVCSNPQLLDMNGSSTPAALTFYKRAKALYDANYEDDRVTIVQALILMGWYWEGPEDVTKNVFYWSGVAVIIAQGSGMHRSVEGSQLSRADKRLWKRIWWTLFTRDRSVAVAFGRPVNINTDDLDIEMICEDDFIEDEQNQPGLYPPDQVHVQFFLQYVKLCEIMGLVLAQQYSVASKVRRQNAFDLTQSDMALADWLHNCPKEVYWERPRHHFWSALLHSNYYTTLCLLHRAHTPPATSQGRGSLDAGGYPSRNIAFQAAGMITSIIENLEAHGELRFAPAFIVYSLFSALIMHVYQMRSPNPSIVATTQERINACMSALKEVSKVWIVAKMVLTLFESILGNKTLEEKLQKGAGKRHNRMRQDAGFPSNTGPVPAVRRDELLKRKYDDMELGLSNGPPAPQVSYERSRPQTPAVTPSHETSNARSTTTTTSMPATSGTSPLPRHPGDTFMGGSNSHNNTRPPTPFNPSYSVPPTPPEFYLVTRNSPPISQNLMENFQPNQLFPADVNMSFPQFSPVAQPVLDPQMQQVPQMHHASLSQQQPQPSSTPIPGQGGTSQLPQRSMRHQDGSPVSNMQNITAGLMPPTQAQHGWPNQYEGGLGENVAGSPDDSWSNSSWGQGPIVPATLNVDDWFQFFGLDGDLSASALHSL
ncbi:MAG: Cutinase transcription factor 1 alpha [Sarea resinae]|nr:MAG: Cutinase transcription factor 1 alpha [Sarea resinae]